MWKVLWQPCFGPGTKSEQSSHNRVNKVDKGHLAQNCCHCAASLHGQMSLAPCQPSQPLWIQQMGLCPSVKVPLAPRVAPWTLFYQLLLSGQQPREGEESAANTCSGKDPTAPCQSSSSKAGLGAASFPMPPPQASLPAQEGYHTFLLCQLSCLPNHREDECIFTRGV